MAAKENPIDLHMGARVKRLRQAQGLSQAQLASRLGWSQGNLSDYERGAGGWRLRDIIRVAEVLGVPLADVLGPPLKYSGVVWPDLDGAAIHAPPVTERVPCPFDGQRPHEAVMVVYAGQQATVFCAQCDKRKVI